MRTPLTAPLLIFTVISSAMVAEIAKQPRAKAKAAFILDWWSQILELLQNELLPLRWTYNDYSSSSHPNQRNHRKCWETKASVQRSEICDIAKSRWCRAKAPLERNVHIVQARCSIKKWIYDIFKRFVFLLFKLYIIIFGFLKHNELILYMISSIQVLRK